MKNTNNELRNHIIYEFYAGLPNRENILMESRGIVSGLHEVVKAICEEMSDQIWETCSVGDETTKTYSGDVRDFNLSTFFQSYIVHLTTIYDEGKTKYSGGLLIPDSFSDAKDGIICHPIIELTVTGSDSLDMGRTIMFSIGHELTHAFNDYQYASKNGLTKEDIINNICDRQNYDSITTTKQSRVQNEKAVANLLYLLNRSERNAYIAQLKEELESVKDKIKDSTSAWNAVLSTASYKKFKQIERVYMQLMSESLSNSSKEQVIRTTNKILGKSFVDYGRVKRFYTNIWSKWKKKYLTTASKIVYDIFKENNLMMDGNMSGTDILLKP